ncbi:ABC transporter permease [Paenarthrobacter nicotinovorans]|uniref:ABC transporter permease n=1 Tax=Paenarthrobacter nicotinovorans TaxID=29320 RepID=UPI003749A32B
MIQFILRRLASGVVLVLAVSTIGFLLLYATIGDVARRILGQDATPEIVARKAAQLGVDRPLYVQYWDWLSHAVTGNFGQSWFTGVQVSSAVGSRLSVTLSLVLCATILTAIISVLLGIWAARKRGWADRVVQLVSVLGYAVPGFLIALGLVVAFAINLKWFKPTGFTSFATSPAGWLSTAILPIIALTIGGIAAVTQQIRGSMIDALRQDYVRTLRTRGLATNRIVYKHVLRNAATPALAVLAVQFVGLLGGTVVIEQVFALPGIGQIAVTATTQGDVPLVMGLVVVSAIIVVIVNLVIDLLQGFLNPKVRLS